MALPPKGDPRRPLQLAIRSCQLLGLIFVLFAMLAGAGMALAPGAGRIALVLGVVLVPGVLYIITAVFLKRRREWAVPMGLVVASLHAVIALIAFIVALTRLPNTTVATIVTGFWVLALAQLIQHLMESTAAMRADADQHQRGFEVLPLATEPEDREPRAE